MDEREFYEGLGGLIAARRDELGLNQTQLAQQVGMSRSTLANIEVGRQRLLVHQLWLLAKSLKIADPADLLPEKRLVVPSPLNISGAELSASEREQIESFFSSVPKTKRRMANS